MIIRHVLYKVDYSAPDLCGETTTDMMGIPNVTATLKVNGVTILTSTSLYSYTGLLAPVNCGSGITVTNIQIKNLNCITVTIDGIDIGDNIDYYVTIGYTGYYSFTNTFKLFGYDLGNNILASITANPNMDIILCEHEPAYPTPANIDSYAGFSVYRQPGTSYVWYMNRVGNVQTYAYTRAGVPVALYLTTDNARDTYLPSATPLVQTTTAPIGTCVNTITSWTGKCEGSITWTANYYINDETFLDYKFENNGRDCNIYTYTNYFYYPDANYTSSSATTYSVTIYQYVNGVWVSWNTVGFATVGNGISKTYTFTEDGTYKLVIKFQNKAGTCICADYVFQIGCNTLECVLDKLEGLLCCCSTDTCVDKDYYIYNWGVSLMGIMWMYRWEEQELIDNSGVTPLASTDFAELAEMFENLYNGTYRFCNSCLNSCTGKVNVVNTCF